VDASSEVSVAAVKDAPHSAAHHTMTRGHIDGVELLRSTPATGRNGVTVEAWRRAWDTGLREVDQLNVVTLRPGTISAWHLHRSRFDGLLVVAGELRLVLYDARSGSATRGAVDEVTATPADPRLVVIPPSVWHGVQVLGTEPAVFLNCFDRSYDSSDPDEWRLPVDSDEVPYRFS
jgi:dTDP-4-dehydrorhamnose 3,5-epimerase